MGMFDTVIVPCPQCGERVGFQSKGGACSLAEYTLEEAPADVLSDINRHSPQTCEKCGTVFSVETTVSARSVTIAAGPLLLHESKTRRHVLEALRFTARMPCRPDNCGSVCLCPPCHARAALEEIDPEWRP